MNNYEIFICVVAALFAIFIVSIIRSESKRPIKILQTDNPAQALTREQIRKMKEYESEKKEKKKLEEIKEKQERDEKTKKQLLEETNKRELAEAALLEGKDVCLNCYTIEPRRCYCGHCTACYGYCPNCDD